MLYSMSPSKVESFRKFLDDSTGFFTEEKLIADLTQPKVWTPKMEFGTAFHSILEQGIEPFLVRKEVRHQLDIDGVDMPIIQRFTHEELMVTIKGVPEPMMLKVEDVKEAIRWRLEHPTAVFEVWNEHELHLPTGDTVKINMRIDSLEGNYVHEFKTTDKPAKYVNYSNSAQWKLYALSTGAAKVRYTVFQYFYNEVVERYSVIPQNFDMLPYPNMEGDIKVLVAEFIHYCNLRGIQDCILPRK